jgi:hypothetical protein
MADNKCPDGTTWQLVTCGKPTKPPHKNEKNPGVCSRTKGFCVPPTPDWTCWQHGKNFILVKEPRHFKDCKDAVATFNKEAAEGKHEASTQPGLQFSGPPPTVSKSGKNWTAKIALRWSVDASKTVVTIPDITWDDMSDADRDAVRAVVAALQAHEEGHVQTAVDYAAELSANGGDILSATAPTEQEARDALKRKITERRQAVTSELNQRNNSYDDTTAHGVKQSNLPGGVDVRLECP